MARIDRDDRTGAVYDAAVGILARGGFSALTLRELAEVLGGSMSLVTHYFPTQADLMHGVLDHQLALFDGELRALDVEGDDLGHLRTLVEWFLPTDDESWNQERARVLLAVRVHAEDPWIRPYLDRVESTMRHHLELRLRPLVNERDIPLALDLIRMVLNGVVLSTVEHRRHWTADRQLATLGLLWAALPWKDGIDAPHA